ncbi:LysR family transcriptional regulator [Pediococcus parvulus]|uniref:LysR family transcriptional regulator n=1 Tax=Pediococcus parvulus TaxID=54062 RepID=A0AAP5WFM0_9LACO|nr:LysR family transcriptional regulator [Pediococcus parvulus]MDV7694822.1 LysR family transcriptional regulator [Pediococcus parvulus]
MIDPYLLEELATFANTGTLAKTAEQLNVTQPTVTRGMQKLEENLGVKLFDRQPNHIKLTKTGQLAAQEAVTLIQANKQMIDKVRNFDQNQREIRIGSVIPGPLIFLKNLLSPETKNRQISSDLIPADQVVTLLINNAYTGIISNQELTSPNIDSQYLGTEKLAVNLDKFMYHANQSTVSFSELENLSFIVLSDIGPWRDIIQNEIPGAKFLYQDQREAFSEITKYSDFPYFSSSLSKSDPSFTEQFKEDDNRVRIPLGDKDAQMKVYFNYLKGQKRRVSPIIKRIKRDWPH